MKLMAVTAGSVAGPRVTGVDPQGQAVAGPGSAGITTGRLSFPGDGQSYAETVFIPASPDFAKTSGVVRIGKGS